jgi:hypothetical protein
MDQACVEFFLFFNFADFESMFGSKFFEKTFAVSANLVLELIITKDLESLKISLKNVGTVKAKIVSFIAEPMVEKDHSFKLKTAERFDILVMEPKLEYIRFTIKVEGKVNLYSSLMNLANRKRFNFVSLNWTEKLIS